MRKNLKSTTIVRIERISKLVRLGMIIAAQTPATSGSGTCVIHTPEPVSEGLWEACGVTYELRKAPGLEAYYGYDKQRDRAIIVIPITSPLVHPPRSGDLS